MKDLLLIQMPASGGPVTPDANDLEAENGDLAFLEGHGRKFQDVVKIIETPLESNVVIPQYGTVLAALPGTPAIDLNSRAQDSVVSAVAFLVEVEPSSDPSEKIAGIRSLSVKQNSVDPAQRDVNLVVALKDGQDIEYTRGA